MSTPTKAEKEVQKHHHAMQFICKRCDNLMQFLLPCEHFDNIKALEERLRLAEEFIRKHQYGSQGTFCSGCDTYSEDPCKSDCELQKILGKEKGGV